jgi:hypothetical protein
MSVTTQSESKTRPEPRAIDLEFIADFLNFDFDTGDVGELAEGDRVFPFLHGLTTAEGLESAKRIQGEVREEILPLIADEDAVNRSDTYIRLERLVYKVNKLKILPEWGVEPVDYYLDADLSDPTNPKPILENKKDADETKELYSLLVPRQKVLNLLGDRWIVNTKVGLVGPGVGVDTEALRLGIYWAIITCLEDGSFSSLNKCKECKRFFVRHRKNQLFCGEKCSGAYFNRDAKEKRVPAFRRRRAAKIARKRAQQAEARAFAKFGDFMRLARKSNTSENESKMFRPILLRLGGWRTIRRWDKKSNDEIWNELDEKQKKLFFSHSRN